MQISRCLQLLKSVILRGIQRNLTGNMTYVDLDLFLTPRYDEFPSPPVIVIHQQKPADQ